MMIRRRRDTSCSSHGIGRERGCITAMVAIIIAIRELSHGDDDDEDECKRLLNHV